VPCRASARCRYESYEELWKEMSMSTGKPEIDFPGGEPPAELQITDVWEGDGAVASPGDNVKVHYVEFLAPAGGGLRVLRWVAAGPQPGLAELVQPLPGGRRVADL
jgi:hypothetical protein